MSYSFSVIATSKKYAQENAESLFKDLGSSGSVRFDEESDFESSSVFNLEEEYYDVLLLPAGTLVFLSIPIKVDNFSLYGASEGKNVGFVVVDEVSMTMVIQYYQSKRKVIDFYESNLEEVNNFNEMSEIIYDDGFDFCTKIIQHICQQDFFEIASDAPTFRFRPV